MNLNDRVECSECEKTFILRLGPITLLGWEVWYADPDDPESQIVIHDGKATCHSCSLAFFDEEEKENLGL